MPPAADARAGLTVPPLMPGLTVLPMTPGLG
jgi:hypothetical protein